MSTSYPKITASTIDQERADILTVIGHMSDRITELQGAIESAPMPLLSAEEHQWVKMAIKKEAQSIEFRQAVISKTTAGLVWMMVAAAVGFAWTLIQQWASTNGYKP
jgi:hypothetical protein